MICQYSLVNYPYLFNTMEQFKQLNKRASKKHSMNFKSGNLSSTKPIKKKMQKEIRYTDEDQKHLNRARNALSMFGQRELNEHQCTEALKAIGYSQEQRAAITEDVQRNLENEMGDAPYSYPVIDIFAACERTLPDKSEFKEAFEMMASPGATTITLANLQQILANSKKAGYRSNTLLDSISTEDLKQLLSWGSSTSPYTLNAEQFADILSCAQMLA